MFVRPMSGVRVCVCVRVTLRSASNDTPIDIKRHLNHLEQHQHQNRLISMPFVLVTSSETHSSCYFQLFCEWKKLGELNEYRWLMTTGASIDTLSKHQSFVNGNELRTSETLQIHHIVLVMTPEITRFYRLSTPCSFHETKM